MQREVAVSQPVFDKPVGCFGIGNAKQRFGKRHQSQALFCRERIFTKNILQSADSPPGVTDGTDQQQRFLVDISFLLRRKRGPAQQRSCEFRVILTVGRIKRGYCRHFSSTVFEGYAGIGRITIAYFLQ